jgi:hypothetical protein
MGLQLLLTLLAGWLARQQQRVAYLLAADKYQTPRKPADWCQAAGQPHSKRVFNPSSHPAGLPLSTPQPLTSTLIERHRSSDRLWLGPRWYPVQEHLFEAPDLSRHSRRHRRRTRPPHLGRTPTIGRDWLGQSLA